jgi:hypothetical protein
MNKFHFRVGNAWLAGVLGTRRHAGVADRICIDYGSDATAYAADLAECSVRVSIALAVVPLVASGALAGAADGRRR